MDRNDDIHIDERTYIAIINEDGTYDADTWIAELEDLYGYQEQLHALKLANGWDVRSRLRFGMKESRGCASQECPVRRLPSARCLKMA